MERLHDQILIWEGISMDAVWIIVLVLPVYFSAMILISAILALMTRKNEKSFAKEALKETFWDFFFELLNPFNWI